MNVLSIVNLEETQNFVNVNIITMISKGDLDDTHRVCNNGNGAAEKGDDEMKNGEEYQDDEWDNYLVWAQRCNDAAEKQYEQEQKENVRP